MSNTIRIRTTPNGNDKYLKVKLEQDFDFIEILSLKISQEDTYRKFCSDYGVIVGRVVINNGFGVPNAKVSVFIPLDDVDKNDPLISGLYPYEVITDKNIDGIRYNLLPQDGDPTNPCFTPIGTFPSKREVLDNDTILNVYCKYYKFTTTTNHAGDFMLFGVPLGTYTVHVDADISDIGIASQRPYDLISQGTPSKMFYSPNKFKEDKNLDKLIQVKSANAGVNVQPFWGDTDNCEIGISRLDIDLNYSLRPAAIFMGSIYGDQHKHSVNKRCRPRKALGEMCQQVTGPGSVEMIRHTIDGQIESFDVEGGRVIDDDGTWAYQIPMNLDYMVTDEEGNLVLSQDPNKGIPTRARVRFRIGMDETGGEGRVRTRAKYLVPNNPKNTGEIDYSFDSNTKDTSFRDMYWNKIYSVSNFISRFQRNTLIGGLIPAKSRAITGMKNVDACAGDKTPFPYNRVDTNLNPIFFIICLIIKIIAFLIYVINLIFIPVINAIIAAINAVIGAICGVINSIINAINTLPGISISTISCPHINSVGCITVKCPDDEPSYFAPGCQGGSTGFNNANPAPNYYCGDPFGHSCSITDYAVGLDNCIAFEMAKALDLFKFDFYNDWINGTLFGFLLKYKKKHKGREIFCEYDCGDYTGDPNYTGVDGNNNGVPDNSCFNNLLLDTCFNDGGSNEQDAYKDNGGIREGVVKKVGDEFYYAATTHDTSYKLFATELIGLGSVFNCDWQGIPNIQPLLIPTSYKIPPDIQELNDSQTTVEACGMVDIGGTTGGEFFSVDCLGLHVNYNQCLNIRHICEIGVDIDEAQEDSFGNITVPADCIIGSNDIDDNKGKWIRDVFFGLNSSSTPSVGINHLNIPSVGFTTNFNLSNSGSYNFATNSNNGQDYVDFRGLSTDSSYDQPEHSFFFYFGILPGKTAIEKMNQRFFNICKPITRDDFIIQTTTSATSISASTGVLSFTFVGGTAPYTYVVTGVGTGSMPTSYGPVSGTCNPTATLIGLGAGMYTITGTDSLGNVINQTVIISGPPSLYCSALVTQNVSTSISNDGIITLTALGGGVPNYSAVLKDASGTIIYNIPNVTSPYSFNNLPVDSTIGYSLTITDSVGDVCVTTGITITGPNQLVLSTVTATNILCYGDNSGAITLSTTGGLPPLTITTTGPFGFSTSSLNMSNLVAGTYVTTIVDSLGTTVTTTNVLTQPAAPMVVTSASAIELGQQCDPTQYFVPFYISSGAAAGPVTVEYSIDNSVVWNTVTLTYVNSSTPLIINPPSSTNISINMRIRFRNSLGCISNIVTVQAPSIALPPSTLTLNTTGINNTKQCTPLVATFGFNISYLTRAPYNVSYTINGGSPITTTTSVNPTIITTSVPTANSTIAITVTDSKGCVSPTLPINMTVPTAPLTTHIVTTGSGPYIHTVTATGGIGPYTGTGVFNDNNPTITVTVTDSVGCTSTATG